MSCVLCLQNQLIIFVAFLVFEVCVGMFWPSMSTMRGKYVPEESKSLLILIFCLKQNFRASLIIVANYTKCFKDVNKKLGMLCYHDKA